MIHFVGAGPGAEDLITVRGAELLRKAGCIIYAGSLVNPALLKYAGEECSIYNSAEMTLEEVISVMEKAEAEGMDTVRLHTGDASLYGAIREQMDILGAAAALNAEYTLPEVSQSVVITRMAGRTPVPQKEGIAGFAAHGCTMVIFLSSSMVEEVQRELLKGDYDEDTPAAIVYKATWPDEKVVRCTVGTLAESAARENITKTALIMAGGFLGECYERSKLYDPAFSTEFRKAVR